jgi:type II secretory pathway component PulF
VTPFAYTAVSAERSASGLLSGTRRAHDERTLRRELRNEGLIAVQVRPLHIADAVRARLSRERIRGSDAAWFFQTLRLLLDARVPVEEAMRSMIEIAPRPRLRDVCERVRSGLRSGTTLSAAIEGVEGLASAQHVALIRSGEASGRLDHAVALVDQAITTRARIKRVLVSRLTYPAILLLAAVGAVWYLATYVVPSISEQLTQMGAELPWPTRATFVASGVVAWALPIVALVILGLVLARDALLTPTRRKKLDGLLMRTPVVGSMLWHGQAATVCDVMHTMLAGGADLLEALGQAQEVVSSPAIADRLAKVRGEVREGRDFAASLREHRVCPPMIGTVIQAGVTGGTLTPAFAKATDLCLERQETLGERLLTLLEPAVLVVMAGAVGWVVYSLVAGMLAVTNAGGLG